MHAIQQWFNASLQRKISGLLAVLLSFLFVVIIYSICKLKMIDAEMHEVAEVDVPLSELVNELEMMQLKQHLMLEQYRLKGQIQSATIQPDKAFSVQRDTLGYLLDKATKVLKNSIERKQIRFSPEQHQQLLLDIEEFHQHSDNFELHLKAALQDNKTPEVKWSQFETTAAKLDKSIVAILAHMENLTLEASRYTDKHESEFMWVNTGLGVCALVLGLYLTFYILQIFRFRIGRIKAEIENVHQSIEDGEPIISPSFSSPEQKDELAELEHDLKLMVLRLSEEITNRQEIEQQLLILATKDKLTGCYNRHKWDEQLKMQLGLAERGSVFSIVLLDVDYFKAINDQYGHHTGDKVLQYLADSISGRLRKTDTLYRIGGEEFIVLLPQQQAKAAAALAEILRQHITSLDQQDLPAFTVSFGVTEYQQSDNEDSIVKRADQALYQAKTMGRNRVQLC